MGLDASFTKKDHRLQYRFWLDVVRQDEYHLAEYVETLKERRSFAQTIRDALSLIQDLRQGSVRILLLLFPWVWDKIAAEVRATMVMPANNGLIPELQAQMTRMEQLLMQQPPVQKELVGLRPLQLPTKTEPELEIKTASADVDDKPSWNNHISMAKLLGSFDHLSAEMLAYGVRKGMIPPDKGKAKPVLVSSPTND